MTNLIHLTALFLTLTNMRVGIQPSTNNPLYFTNFYGTNLVLQDGAEAQHDAIIGPTVHITWDPAASPVIMQCSTNLADWQDIRIVHVGSTNWWMRAPDHSTFFRLRGN